MYDDFITKIGKDDRFMHASRVNVYRLLHVLMQIYVYDLTCVIRFDY